MDPSLQLGYEDFVSDLSELLLSSSLPFIYINDAFAKRTTSTVVASTLADLSNRPSSPRIHYAIIDAISCFSPRILYDSIINSLTNWTIEWKEGCSNWMAKDVPQRWNDNLDGFLHGLQAVNAFLSTRAKAPSTNEPQPSVRLVVAITQAQKLKENIPDLIVPFTRLAELVRLS